MPSGDSFPHYLISCLRFPKLSKSTTSSKDLNKMSSSACLLWLWGKKDFNEIWGNALGQWFSKCGPWIPGGPHTLSEACLVLPLPTAHLCEVGFSHASAQPTNRSQQTVAGMGTQLLKEIRKWESKTLEIRPNGKQCSSFHQMFCCFPKYVYFWLKMLFMLTCQGFIIVIFKWINKIFLKIPPGFASNMANMGRYSPHIKSSWGPQKLSGRNVKRSWDKKFQKCCTRNT